jgi:hypothetical protein
MLRKTSLVRRWCTLQDSSTPCTLASVQLPVLLRKTWAGNVKDTVNTARIQEQSDRDTDNGLYLIGHASLNFLDSPHSLHQPGLFRV